LILYTSQPLQRAILALFRLYLKNHLVENEFYSSTFLNLQLKRLFAEFDLYPLFEVGWNKRQNLVFCSSSSCFIALICK